jgi:hypothetical protein
MGNQISEKEQGWWKCEPKMMVNLARLSCYDFDFLSRINSCQLIIQPGLTA